MRLASPLSFRSRLFVLSLGLIAASVLAAELYLRVAMDRHLSNRIRDDLFVRLALVERQAALIPNGDQREWDALADELGRIAEGRVTFIRTDGTVMGDSELAVRELATVENHGHRPEVREAIAGRPGASTRWSATLKQRMMYAAGPVRRSGAVIGVARLAVPLDQVDKALSEVRRILLFSAAVALMVALLITLGAAHVMARVLRQITRAAGRLAAGDLTVRTRVSGHDDISALGSTLDQLAENLSATLIELRSERDLLGGVLESMHEGVLVLDGQRRILLVNQALRSMLLLGADTLGKTPLEVIRNAELDAILDRASHQTEPAAGEIEIAGIKPRRFLVRASTLASAAREPLRAPWDGATSPTLAPTAPAFEPGALLAVFVDVTDIRRLETVRRDFVANVSHELRTPITAVRSAAETLEHTAGDPQASARFVAMIARNAERLTNLVDDLLELSRIESREVQPRLEEIELAPVVQHVVSLFRDRAAERQLTLETKLAAEARVVVADRRGLDQVLSNLVDNAVKYASAGGSITIAGRPDGAEHLEIAVSDTGPGIEARHLPRLFERFYRVDAGRSREAGGTGLGLSIVKHLVEAMHGEITVESTVGKGTTFRVVLPTSR